jgi:O-antigen/teichoic acid export membrane protein
MVPKIMGIEEYGYWQLYLFYSSYVGFLHFGWNDGIYLKYGGKEYKKLDKQLLYSQFWMLVIFQILLGIAFISISTVLNIDSKRLFILITTVLCMFIVNVRLMLIYILQCTNRIKEYAQITIMEKLLYCILILLFLLVGINNFKLLIWADIIGKTISLLYAIYCCRNIVLNNLVTFYFNFRETFENINIGIKLMFANIASMMIIGTVRLGIERNWDVATFGKVSLALNLSNLIMLLINAIGIIMYPTLRRTNKDNLPIIYLTMRTPLMVVLLALLIIYYPLKAILTLWLPQYVDSFVYMGLIFPICIYEGKMALLINTFLKTLRKEKFMLIINLAAVVLSIILTFFFTILYENLNLAIVSIVILLAFRGIFAEIFLSKLLNIRVNKDIFFEILLSIIFIIPGWFLTANIGIGLYLVAYVSYILIKRKSIKLTFVKIKQFMLGE